MDKLEPYRNLALSPDGMRASVSLANDREGASDIWIVNAVRGLRTRFTFDAADEFVGIWSPDGAHIAFNARRKGRLDLYRKAASGAGGDDLLASDHQVDKTPTSWSTDGRFILYSIASPVTGPDIWVLPLAGDRKPFPFADTGFDERLGQFSPDGRWVAYASSESGRSEVYVAPFPGPGGEWQISEFGGGLPRWRRDGKELFYHAPDNKLMVATVAGGADRIDVEAVRPVFEMRVPDGEARSFYDVTSDGQRFLMIVPEPTLAPLTLVSNWPALLENRR